MSSHLTRSKRDEIRLVAGRDRSPFLMPWMQAARLLDLGFSNRARPYLYFAWGCFRNFGPGSVIRRVSRDTRHRESEGEHQSLQSSPRVRMKSDSLAKSRS